MVIVASFRLHALLLLIKRLVEIALLIRMQIEGNVRRFIQLSPEMEIDGIGIEFGRRRFAIAVLEVAALILLVLHAPIPAVFRPLMRHAVKLFAETAVGSLKRRLLSRDLLRNDVDDAALCIRTVKRGSRTVQHLDALNAAEVFHRCGQRCRRPPCIILPDAVDEDYNVT